jgi:hypothetical protein
MTYPRDQHKIKVPVSLPGRSAKHQPFLSKELDFLPYSHQINSGRRLMTWPFALHLFTSSSGEQELMMGGILKETDEE